MSSSSLAGKYKYSVAVFLNDKMVQPGAEVVLTHEQAEVALRAEIATRVDEPVLAVAPPVLRREFQASRVTKLAPRIDRRAQTAAQRALAGTYRIIHGSVEMPRPFDEWHTADGKEIDGAPKTIRVGVHPSKFAIVDDPAKNIFKGDVIEWVGDEVWLNDEDAAFMLDAGLIESLDARPSQCGKVWTPPKPNPRSA